MTHDDAALGMEIRRLVQGYQVSQAMHVAATLGLADLLVSGRRTSDDLAKVTGTHAPSLYRLLRALATVGVLREGEDHAFELTPLGEHLRSDAPDSMAGWAAFIGRPPHWQAWSGLLHSVQTGDNAFRHQHGTDVWTYRSTHPDESAVFDRAMMSLVRQSSAALLAAYDFGRFRTLADIGGGNGALLATVLGAYPALQGVLFDQPHVVSGAATLLASAGVADRCRIIGGSFFASVPEGCDAYLLSRVIHDWPDEDALRILQAVRRAAPGDAALLLIERVIGPPNTGPDSGFSDLNMLVAAGGRERTGEGYADLLQASGFRLSRIVSAGIYSVLEAAPIGGLGPRG